MGKNVGSVRVGNFTPYGRDGVVTVRVPFLAGMVPTGSGTLTVGGRPAEVDFVELWPDASMRSARLRFPVTLLPHEEASLPVAFDVAGLSTPDFAWHPWIAAGVPALRMEFMDVELTQGLEHVMSGPYVQAYRSRHRVPMSEIWVELNAESYSNMPFTSYWLRWGYSPDNSVPNNTWLNRRQVTLEVRGALMRIRHGKGKTRINGKVILDDTNDGHGTKVKAGQSQMVRGVLLFADANPFDRQEDLATMQAESLLPILAIAENWADVPGSYGPLGEIPAAAGGDLPAWRSAVLAQAVSEWPRRPTKDAWANTQHIGVKDPASAGAQGDFGLTKLGRDIKAGVPYRLHGIEASVYQETCRPSHHREPDVSPIRAKNHPTLWIMGGKPHQHSPDLLNGDWAQSDFKSLASWGGFDIEHHSINHLCEYAYVTGDPGALILADEEADIWLCSYQNRGDWAGPGRRDGRVLQAGCWLYHTTLRQDLLAHIELLANKVNATGEIVYRRSLREGDGGMRGRRDYWVPWEQGIRVRGMEMAIRLTGHPEWRPLMNQAARQVAMEGFQKDAAGNETVTYATAWDDTQDFDAGDGGLTLWTLAAILLGKEWATESEDQEWLQRCNEILASALKGRGQEPFDAATDWLAVGSG